jgi:cytochrome P450
LQSVQGTVLATLLYAIHHDPRYFKEPHKFMPERFILPNGELEKNPKIMPFQAGKAELVNMPVLHLLFRE